MSVRWCYRLCGCEERLLLVASLQVSGGLVLLLRTLLFLNEVVFDFGVRESQFLDSPISVFESGARSSAQVPNPHLSPRSLSAVPFSQNEPLWDSDRSAGWRTRLGSGVLAARIQGSRREG